LRKTIKYDKESDHIRINIGKARALIFQTAVLPDLKNDLSVAKLAAGAQ
jgi:hypothetical protein